MRYIAYCIGQDDHEFPLVVRTSGTSMHGYVKKYIRKHYPYVKTIKSVDYLDKVVSERQNKSLYHSTIDNLIYK